MVWFREASQASGLNFQHRSGHANRFYMPEMVTGGVGLFDYDRDGWIDIICVNGGSIERQAEQPAGHRLYRNLGGFRFEDATERAGLGGVRGYGMGCACGDFDGDGFPDLLITHLQGSKLFRNQRDGTFAEVTSSSGIDDAGWGTSAAFCDYDLDGDLDLLVTRYLRWSPQVELPCFSQGGRPDYCSPLNYKSPAMDALYENLGGGRFTNVTARAGLDQAYGNGLGVACADFTGDGKIDLFVANDGMPNQLWVNRGNGQFAEEAALRGCAVSSVGMPRAGMGVAAVDLGQRGALDLFVTHLVGEGNGLFINSNGYFVDHLSTHSVNATSRPWTGFGVGFADFDNDGWLDAYVANGRVKYGAKDLDPRDPYAEPNSLLRGQAGGAFEEVSIPGGTDPVLLGTSRGLALGDLDHDGGMDVVIVNKDGPLHVLKNVHPARGAWAAFRVLNRAGTDAFNARVTLQAGGRRWFRDVLPNQSYCSSHDPRVHFGLGSVSRIESVVVRWPEGQTESFASVSLGTVQDLRQGRGEPVLPE